MGRVKDHFWDEICAAADNGYGPEPDDLEMLKIDAERALDRYLEALKQRRTNDGDHNAKSF